MTERARRGAEPGPASARPPSGEPSLDQLLAEPIVQQLMHRDRTDEGATRRLLQQIAATRSPVPAEPDSGAGDPSETARLLQEITRVLRDRCERRLRDWYPGMTWARCAVLIHLARHQGVKQAVLADSLAIRPITLVRLLDRLEADSLVARLPHPGDRRARLLVLTAKARPIIEYAYDLTRKTYDELQFGISRADASQLCTLLRRIRSNLIDRRDETASSAAIGGHSPP
jgi:MarR family transcriptional regulator, transcriptional regulator for hemolysin